MQKDAEINNQSLNSMKFKFLQFREEVLLFVAIRNSSRSINCFGGNAKPNNTQASDAP